MAVLFALFAMLASFGIGCGTQINAIAEVLETNLPVSLPRIAIGIVFGIITAVIIIGGIETAEGLCFKPLANATRAQAATMTAKLYKILYAEA